MQSAHSLKWRTADQAEDDEVCRECGSKNLVENPAAGNQYCQDCGLEHRSYMIDYRTEWRTFSDKDKADDGVRVGGPVNLLLSNAGLATSLDKADGNIGRMMRNNDPDRKLKKAFKEVERLCDLLNLTTQRVKDRGYEVFKRISDLGYQRSMRLEVMYAGTVMYVSRLEGGTSSRTFKEVMLHSKVHQKEIAKCFKRIERDLKGDRHLALTEAGPDCVSFAANYATYLNLPQEIKVMIGRVALIAKPGSAEGELIEDRPWDSRSPASIAAAVVFVVTQFPKCPRHVTAKEVSDISGVAEGTIAQCVRDLQDALPHLIPATYATAAEIKATFPSS